MSYVRPNPTAPGSAAPLVPFACYTVIALKVEGATAKSEPFNKRLDIETQILAPDSVTNANGTVSRPAGQKGVLRLSFSDKSMQGTIDALTKLGVTLPAPQATFDADVAAITAAAIEQLSMKCFDMTVKSKREAMLDGEGKPMLDSRGQPIQGPERADFSVFGIVGNPRTVAEAGVSVPAY
jgi:hypothetical protein